MKFWLLTLLFISRVSSAALFSEEEVRELSKAGQQSIVTHTKNHFTAHKNTGVGLFYGWKSRYSPIYPSKDGNPPTYWTDAQRMGFVHEKLKPSFKKTFKNSSQLTSWLQKTVGIQSQAPRTGDIEMTSCIMWVIKHLEAAYAAAGKAPRWQQIREILRKQDDRGIVLLDELQKDGWEAIYWNPDTQTPDDSSERKIWHSKSARAAAKVKGYYPTWYTRSNPAPANEYIKIDHMMINYRPTPGSSTRQDTRAIENLKQVPFWVGIANFGEHSFVGYYVNISAAHSPFLPNNRDNIELSKFQPWGKAWSERYGGDKYLSGVIMVPPGTWLD